MTERERPPAGRRLGSERSHQGRRATGIWWSCSRRGKKERGALLRETGPWWAGWSRDGGFGRGRATACGWVEKCCV